jgi:peptidoglycan/LPS O-acetylase OafA/YrhL
MGFLPLKLPKFDGPGPGMPKDQVDGGNPLDRTDTAVLKGVAILAIAFHNFSHILTPVGENEFSFDPGRVSRFFHTVCDPHYTFQALFSYLGHFGVELFIFLSAYGLALNYWKFHLFWKEFFAGRVRKIYPTFLLAVGCWACQTFLWAALFAHPPGLRSGLAALWARTGATLWCALGISTLIPHGALQPVGPWWFLSFILQFYALWPFLPRLVDRFGGWMLAGLSAAGLALVYAVNPFLVRDWSVNLLHSPIGHLPEICLGIAVARWRFYPRWMTAVAAGLLFALSNFYSLAWPLGFASILVLLLWAYRKLRFALRPWKWLVRTGEISMAIFFVNGFIREAFLILAGKCGRYAPEWFIQLAFAFLSVSCSFVVARVLVSAERRLVRRSGAGENASS